MPKDFNQEVDGAGGTRGSIRQVILVVLLLLTAALGYLYFFTGLIKPREQITAVPPSRVDPVKQPLPPRPDQGAMEQQPAATPEDKQPGPATAEKTVAPPASPETKPAVAPAPKPAVAPVPKPAQAPARAKSANTVKAEKKPAAKLPVKAPAAPAPPSAKAQKDIKTKPAPATAVKADKKVKQAVAGKGAAAKGRYTLLAGEFASDRETEKARLKLEKQGTGDVRVRKIKKDVTMHRLFLADFYSHEAAVAELNKLQLQTGSAFILNEKGRYALYAGSFLHEKGAAAEQKRLAGIGVKLALKTVKVSLPISEVTAGSYPGSEDAKKEANRLKKKGIVVRVIKYGQ